MATADQSKFPKVVIVGGGFGGIDDPSLEFDQSTSISNTRAAEITSIIDGNGSLVRATVNLNENVLPNSSQEYIAATILHEVLHAYMNSINGGQSELDHEDMAINYVNKMASALQNMFPNLSLNDATALAYGGLESTATYGFDISHFPNLNNNYQTVNYNHSKGLSGHPCN